MLDLVDLPVTNYNFSFTTKYRLNQFFNVISPVLVVTVSIYNNICAKLQTGINPGDKPLGQPPVIGKVHHMMYANFPGDLSCSIATSVIYY
ncbi:MAG: hypothetical protein R6V16_11380 [Bacteroidales bacterium]